MKNQPVHPHTAAINDKQKNQSKLKRHHALTWLTARFPDIFNNQSCIRPLKIGIIKDLLPYADEAKKAGISKSKLREAIVLYTRRIDYLACLKAREMRIDLNGNPTIQVSAEDAEKAALKIKRRIEKNSKNTRPTALKTQAIKQSSPEKIRTLEHPPAFSTAHASPSTKNAAAVTIKRKTTRAFDPNAVARLKEKLGLTQQAQQKSILTD